MTLPRLPDVPRERRQTSTRVAVVALGLLCLLGLVLGLRGLLTPADSPISSGATPEPSTTSAEQSGGAAATASSVPASPSSTSADRAIGFVSPTGNIRCVLSTRGARCDIIERDWEPPAKPPDCRGQWGPGLYVDARTSGVVCADDRVEGGSALEYGDSVTRGDYRCDSSEDGMRCGNTRTQRGFTIARGSYQLS